jgi:hypothetical protein
MRNTIPGSALSLVALLVLAAVSAAQPPDRRPDRPDPFGRRPGPGAIEQRVLDDLKLTAQERETVDAAFRGYQDNIRRLTEMAGADLMVKMKTLLSEEEYKKLKEATDRSRAAARRDDRRLRVDDIVERLLAFDKNKDGKITKEELPERMQDLIARGDTNKDGALDKDEVRKLAEDLARERTGRGDGRRGRFPPDRGERVGPTGLSARAVERALQELKIEKKDGVESAVKANQENVRKLREMARADLMLKVSDVLNQEQLTKFMTALERASEREGRPEPPRPPDRPGRN